MTERDAHLEGLTIIEKRLVKNYSITIAAGIHTLDDVRPVKLRDIVEIEIALREIDLLAPKE